MIITKVIEKGIDVHSPIEFFSDPEKNILSRLRKDLEKKCYAGCFIISVDRVLRYSDALIDQEVDNVHAKLNVAFEVTACIYSPGDVITGCKVIKNGAQGHILCSKDNASIWLNADTRLAAIREGQLITIRVGACSFSINQPTITINAYPFLPSKKYTSYYINTANHTDTDRAIFADLRKKIEDEQAKIAEMPKGLYDMFEKLVHSYKEIEVLGSDKTIDIFLPMNNNGGEFTGWVSRNPIMNLAKPLLYLETDPEEASNLHSAVAYTQCLTDYFNHLRIIRELTEIYSSKDVLQEHKNVLSIYTQNKF